MTTITTNGARRRRAKAERKMTHGSRSVPVVQANSHLGIYERCGRSGLVNDEGICTGFRSITAMPFFEPRSTRCDAIVDEKERKKKRKGGDDRGKRTA